MILSILEVAHFSITKKSYPQYFFSNIFERSCIEYWVVTSALTRYSKRETNQNEGFIVAYSFDIDSGLLPKSQNKNGGESPTARV